jgi:hypothetical protein
MTTHIKAEDRRGNGDNEVEIYGLESQATGKEEYPMGRTTVQMGQVEVESGPRSVESFQSEGGEDPSNYVRAGSGKITENLVMKR